MTFPSNATELPVPSDLCFAAFRHAETIAMSAPGELHVHPSWVGSAWVIINGLQVDLILHDDLDDPDAWWVVFHNKRIVGSRGA